MGGGQYEGPRLLKTETLRLMFTDHLDGVDGTNRFGLALVIEDVTVGSGAGQRTVTCYRWGSYAGTQLAVAPDERFFQTFALRQLACTEGPARQQSGTVNVGLPALRAALEEPVQ